MNEIFRSIVSRQHVVVSDDVSCSSERIVNVDVVVVKCKVSRLKIVYLLIDGLLFSD